MTISFDLDDTLIPGRFRFDAEKRSFLHRLFRIEPIRKGAPELWNELKKSGYSVFIYTTSYRSLWRVRLFLMSYGMRADRIINQSLNLATLKKLSINASKYPPAFGIDIHIDDSEGLRKEGIKYEFATYVVGGDDRNWTKVLKEKLLVQNGNCA